MFLAQFGGGGGFGGGSDDVPAFVTDLGDFVSASITDMGAVVAVVAGGFFAFLVVRKAFSWGRKAL